MSVDSGRARAVKPLYREARPGAGMTIEGVTTTITLESGPEIDVEWSVDDAVASITHIEPTRRKTDVEGFSPQSQMLAVVIAEQRVLELPGIERVESIRECYESASQEVPEV